MSLLHTGDNYSATITVTNLLWFKKRQIVAFAPSQDKAIEECMALAKADGWAPPVWWQWWRRRDSHEPNIGACL